jgi:hypothetical protein
MCDSLSHTEFAYETEVVCLGVWLTVTREATQCVAKAIYDIRSIMPNIS